MFSGEGHDPQQARYPSLEPQEGGGLQQADQLEPSRSQIINCPGEKFQH